jgi:putative addiction module CopG family antidote
MVPVVDLPPELERLVEARLASGRYLDREHLFAEALRFLELAEADGGGEADDGRLRALVAEGEASGDPEPYDMAAIQAALDQGRSGRA